MQEPRSLRTFGWIMAGLLLITLVAGQPILAARFWLPDAELAAPGLRTAMLQPVGACRELLVNGDLETSGGWQFGSTPAPGVVVTAPVHGGTGAIRLGIAGGNNTVAYSTAFQSVTLPAAAQQIVLTFWERPGVTGDNLDYREVVLLRANLTVLRSLARQNGPGADQWGQRAFDLTDLRGQSIVLYLNVYNNGSGASLVNYLDDISLQSCDNAATPVETPTATATPTASPIATTDGPTETPTGTPTATVTATPQPSALVMRTGTAVVAEGQTEVNTPLELAGATDEQPVGILNVTVLYDASVLNAVACPVSEQFDLLLCNIAAPGLLRLAGVAAVGIRSELKVADLAFAITQPDRLPTQLTVQLETVADIEGDALSASVENGQIRPACPPDDASCVADTQLYLPLVQR